MTILVPNVSLPVLITGTAVLLLSLLFAVRFLSRKRQRDMVREFQEYFNCTVYPRSEFASHLRELPLNYGLLRAGKFPKTEVLCSQEWMGREANELNSLYYLRTGQQISMLSAMEPAGSWYGLEAWIQDLLAAKGDSLRLAGVKRRDEPAAEKA